MDITEFVKALVALAISVLTCFVIPYLRQRMDAEQMNELLKWTKIAVQAAEMIYNETGMGAKKKQYVTDFLLSKGYTLDMGEVDNAIESAVLELKAGVVGEN